MLTSSVQGNTSCMFCCCLFVYFCVCVRVLLLLNFCLFSSFYEGTDNDDLPVFSTKVKIRPCQDRTSHHGSVWPRSLANNCKCYCFDLAHWLIDSHHVKHTKYITQPQLRNQLPVTKTCCSVEKLPEMLKGIWKNFVFMSNNLCRNNIFKSLINIRLFIEFRTNISINYYRITITRLKV